MKKNSRSLVDITLEEAIEVLKLGEGFSEYCEYKIRVKNHEIDRGTRFAQVYYIDKWREPGSERIAVNFSDDSNAVSLCNGNQYYRCHYRIIKYLEGRGFNLELANEKRY